MEIKKVADAVNELKKFKIDLIVWKLRMIMNESKRNNSLNHRRCQTLENKPNYVINSYSEKKINKIPNSSSINNYYKNNISYEMNECKYFPTEYSINSNYYYNQNIFKNNTYNNIPVRVSDSLVIKPAFERRNCK